MSAGREILILLKTVLGFHIVNEKLDVRRMEDVAAKISSVRELNTKNVGIFMLQTDSEKRFFCKTRLGMLLPSLFHLKVNGEIEAIPHPIRRSAGVMVAAFGCLLILTSLVIAVQSLQQSDRASAAMAITTILLISGGLFGILFAFLFAEKVMILSGFKKFISE